MKQRTIRFIYILLAFGLLVHGTVQIWAYRSEYTALEQISAEVPFQKGMSFTTWTNESFNTDWVKAEFQKMKAIGIEWVAINHWWWQDYLNSTTIKRGPWSDTHENMIECFLYAKSIGLHIMYKPMLNLLKEYEWRSYIVYSEDWMNNYTAWMVDNAKAAEVGGVEILCFGTEMGNMQVHSDGVREMIHKIRDVFSGYLTYSANHDSYMYVDWYDAIDFIGISMYTMMTIDWDPTVQQLTNVWDGIYLDLEEMALRWKKPIVFTEIGIQARDGSNLIPNDNQISNRQDISEMENFYLSLFNSRIWTAPWFKGAYWWIWDRAQADDPNLDGFNPVLIQDTIHAQYVKEHVITSSSASILKVWLPFLVGVGMLVLVGFKTRSKVLFPEQLSNPSESKKEQVDISVSEQLNSVFLSEHSKQNHLILGLVLGSLFAVVWFNFTLGLVNFIQKSVSYGIILQLSMTNTIISFVGVILLAILTAIFVLRYFSRGIVMISFLFVILSPYLGFGGIFHNILVILYFNLAVVFLLMGSLILLLRKATLQTIPEVIVFALSVLGLFLLAVLVFDVLAPILLSIPLGIIIIHSRSQSGQITTRSDPQITLSNESPNMKIGRMPMLLVVCGLLAGIIIPFGNSNINMIRMNPISIAHHYLPAIGGALLLCGLWFYIAKKTPDRNFLTSRVIYQPEQFIKIVFLVGLFAVAFIFIKRPILVWAFISGCVIILFTGTFLESVNRCLNPHRLGRNYVFVFLVLLAFIVGFILNGIKGVFVLVLTFLVIKDGQFLRRDPQIDPVPPFDVPLMLNMIIVVAILLIAGILVLYMKLIPKFRKHTRK
jgi:hypothetical protein